MSALATILTVLTATLLLIYYWTRRKFDYWKKRNVPYPTPTPLLGNYADHILQKKNIGEQVQDILRNYPDDPMVGAFYGTEPVAIIQDPELIKLITTKDFYYFNGREVSEHTKNEVVTQNLFFTAGDHWKVLRQNLTPLFSSAKMKNMFHLVQKCALELEELFDRNVKVNKVMDMRTTMARYTMDAICACAFGIDTKVMGKDLTNNPFKKIADVIFEVSFSRGLKTNLRAIWPSYFYGLGLRLFPLEIYQFFKSVLMDVLKERKGQASARQDFVDLMTVLKNKQVITGDSLKNMKNNGNEKVDIRVDDDLLTAQCIVFFAAGFETSSTTSAFTLFELAKKPEYLEKVFAEVDAYLTSHDNQVQYDVTTELPYLEQCIDEALRLYPVLPTITREVYEDYTMPSEVRLEKGMRIHLPVYHLQRNPKYFPNPEEYNPNRFSPENKKNITPYSYFPFGEGPRICIGEYIIILSKVFIAISLNYIDNPSINNVIITHRTTDNIKCNIQ